MALSAKKVPDPCSILTHLSWKFKKCSDFYKTSYTLPKGREENMYEILALYIV